MANYAQKFGRSMGKLVLKKPYDFNNVKKEVTNELTPYYNTETAQQQRDNYTNPISDLKTQYQRNSADYTTQGSRLNQDIAAGRQQRDWQQASEIQGQNQQFGSRGLDMSSPTAQKLQARLQAIQQFNTNQQEQGYDRQKTDLATAQSRFGQDYTTNLGRANQSQADFITQRKRALQNLIAQETYKTAFPNYYQQY